MNHFGSPWARTQRRDRSLRRRARFRSRRLSWTSAPAPITSDVLAHVLVRRSVQEAVERRASGHVMQLIRATKKSATRSGGLACRCTRHDGIVLAFEIDARRET